MRRKLKQNLELSSTAAVQHRSEYRGGGVHRSEYSTWGWGHSMGCADSVFNRERQGCSTGVSTGKVECVNRERERERGGGCRVTGGLHQLRAEQQHNQQFGGGGELLYRGSQSERQPLVLVTTCRSAVLLRCVSG